jgi:N-acetylmuramoyl-L-alanine amidase
MRALILVLCLAISVAATTAAPPGGRADRGSVPASGGDSYTSLVAWGNSCGFKTRWDPRMGNIQMARGKTQLALSVNTRKAFLNGAFIELTLPVLSRNGAPVIAAVDILTTFNPILFPQRNPPGMRILKVCLDPGHGGRDTGKIDRTALEKNYTLLLAREVAAMLPSYGIKPILTRDRDKTMDLSERPDIAQHYGADLFVSLHFNSADNTAVRGLEVHCLPPAGYGSSNSGGGRSGWQSSPGNNHNNRNILLAWMLHKEILHETRMEDRGLKRSHYKVLREARMPAVLIEGGFMSNRADAQNIYNPAFRKKLAQAIVDGIIAYKRAVETP